MTDGERLVFDEDPLRGSGGVGMGEHGRAS